MKQDFFEISLLTHFRKDSELRVENLKAVINYYNKFVDNFEIVIVEDDSESKLSDEVKNMPGVIYKFHKNNGIYQRPLAFNIASLQTMRPVVVSHDTDVIIKPEQLLYSADKLIHEKNLAVMIPYNGVSLFLKENVKQEFITESNYETLEKYAPELANQRVYYENENLLVGNTQSVGGSVAFNHMLYNEMGGYNPNFVGWGHEDHEILHRARKMGFNIGRYGNEKAFLWHLPHDDPNGDKKEKDNPFYGRNAQINQMVRQMDPNNLKEYIKTWNNLK